MKRIVRLTEQDLVKLVKRVILETSEHTKNLYKSWAKNKSGNEQAALSIMDDVFTYLKKLPKKDFAKYTSYQELKSDLDNIMDIETEKSKEDDIEKLYEDDELLVIAAKTWEASCKYGAGSKWCTTSKDTSSYWKRHNVIGTEFFWIFKNKPKSDPNYKFSYHIKNYYNHTDWCNSVNKCVTDLPKNSYPKLHPKYNEIIELLEEFHNNRIVPDARQQNEIFLREKLGEYSLEDIFKSDIEYLMYEVVDNMSYEIGDSLDIYVDEYGEEYDKDYDWIIDDAIESTMNNLDNREYELKEQIIPLIEHSLLYNWEIDSDSLYSEFEDLDILDVIHNIPKSELQEILMEVLSRDFLDNLINQNPNLHFKY